MMNFRKITAVLLAAAMTASMTGASYATELGTVEYTDEIGGSGEEIDSLPGGNGEYASVDAVEVSAELDSTVAELDSMEPGTDYVDGEGVFIADSEEEARNVASQYGGTLKSYSHRVAVVEFPGSTVDAFSDTASVYGATTYVDPNYIGTFEGFEDSGYTPVSPKGQTDAAAQPNDPFASKSNKYYQYFHEKINTHEAHDITKGKGVKIAVIDLGTNPEHEDLGGKKDDVHTQCVKSLVSVNGIDKVGHGVFCNGVIKATKNNGLGGYGVAPDAEVYSIKIADSRSFEMSRAVEALSIAMEDQVNVISMSLGSDSPMASLQQLISEAYNSGITVVAAAGNGGGNKRHYPAAYDHVIAVAASDTEDKLAKYSNYGDWVKVVAPGSAITSTYLPGDSYTIKDSGTVSKNNAYGVMSGTSMATPMVAGVAALCYAANPEFSTKRDYQIPDIITNIIYDTSNGKTYTYEDHSVTGMVQADKAVEAAKYYKMNTSYLCANNAGTYGAYLRENIARGKSIKFDITDLNGNIVKKGAKEACWSSSDPARVSVANGKVKCTKTAPLGEKVVVTATLGNDTMTINLTVTEPVVAAGYCYTTYSSNGNSKLKIKSTIPINVKTGTTVNISNPYEVFNASEPYVNLVYSKDASRVKDGTFGHAADKAYNYKITIPKSRLKNLTLNKEKNGKISAITFNKAGTLNVKFTALDGSNKSFTYKVTAR